VRILYVSQYFPPEMGAPAARVYELAREWAAAGHDVTVLTAFAHHPTGVKAAADRRVLTRRERKDGVEVVRTYVYAAPNQGVGRRMASYVSFMASAALIGSVRVKRPDVVVATSPQLLCACAGYALARRFGAPFVFEVRDLWPESIGAVEAMRQGLVMRTLRRVADFLYRRSERIVTVGQGYKRKIVELYSVDPDKIAVVPNGIDTRLFEPRPRDDAVRARLGWGDRPVVLYLGTHGMAHALHVVLGAARSLQIEGHEALFAFVGEGAEKARLEALAADWSLENVQFHGQQPRERVPELYAACDVGLVTLRDTPLFQEVLPSKIFEYLAMERPVLLSVRGEARRLVEAAAAGVYVPPEDPDALAEAVRAVLAAPDELERMGERGRCYVLEHYDRSRQAAAYVGVLATLSG